jgi:hypothetical protein
VTGDPSEKVPLVKNPEAHKGCAQHTSQGSTCTGPAVLRAL